VHRLLQREGLGLGVTDERLRQAAEAILGLVSAGEIRDRDGLLDEAVARIRTLSAQPDLRDLYLSGQAYHEVPFAMREHDRVVRGTIDCLVQVAPDRITVLEFKTGTPRAGHEAQTEIYKAAAQALFPGATVDARLVYASAPGAR
jgi:ATP-dependent exoDNAse (exonuclease V) beta subunit